MRKQETRLIPDTDCYLLWYHPRTTRGASFIAAESRTPRGISERFGSGAASEAAGTYARDHPNLQTVATDQCMNKDPPMFDLIMI